MPSVTRHNPDALRANRRMAYYLLAFLLILFILAGLTYPFVDHVAKIQNILYGVIVTAPFVLINAIFIRTTGKDLSKINKSSE